MKLCKLHKNLGNGKNHLSLMGDIMDLCDVGSFSRSFGPILGLFLTVWVNLIQSGMDVALLKGETVFAVRYRKKVRMGDNPTRSHSIKESVYLGGHRQMLLYAELYI
jgi:hypothetical protein